MLAEQSPKLPTADPETLGQSLDVGLVQCTGFDQHQRARDRVGRAAPHREIGRGFRPAAQAGAEAGLLRAAVGKKITFFDSGVRAGQTGRQ